MMSKKWYKLVFKQVQPIHIGIGSYGVVNETRIFIPGWTIWGALTKAYNLKNNRDLSENQELFENISCFYPCFDEEGEDILFPNFENGKFYLGNYSEDKFRSKFVDTFVSTAINPYTNTALDESLHELNIILPGVKSDYFENEKEKQLYWVGIVQMENQNLPEGFEVFVGGDVKYGLGRIVLTLVKNLDDGLVKDYWIEANPIKNYYPANGNFDLANGKIELLVEVKESWKKRDLQVVLREEKGFFWIPGSQSNSDLTIKAIKKGIYQSE